MYRIGMYKKYLKECRVLHFVVMHILSGHRVEGWMKAVGHKITAFNVRNIPKNTDW